MTFGSTCLRMIRQFLVPDRRAAVMNGSSLTTSVDPRVTRANAGTLNTVSAQIR